MMRVQVAIGVMRVDLSTLLLERRVALANVPAGSVSIQLSGRDMGAFLRHPLFQQTAATAVQNQAFVWDRDSVIIDHAQGTVWFTGTWAGNGRRYRMLMRPGGSSSQAGGNSSSAQRRPPLQVGAQLLADDGNPASDAAAHAKGDLCVSGGVHCLTHLLHCKALGRVLPPGCVIVHTTLLLPLSRRARTTPPHPLLSLCRSDARRGSRDG